MENRGRKRKVSGTILAGAFTVPAAMNAVQQNTVNANLFTESVNSVSDFFCEKILEKLFKSYNSRNIAGCYFSAKWSSYL